MSKTKEKARSGNCGQCVKSAFSQKTTFCNFNIVKWFCQVLFVTQKQLMFGGMS